MAPKRRRGDEQIVQKPSKRKAAPPLNSPRVTRSSTRRLNGSGSTLADPQPGLSKPKVTSKKKNPNPRAAKVKFSEDGSKGNTKTITIEHCKQCKSFLTRAIQVKDGLENGISGITVLLNPEKPRKGCFEIREEGGDTFISLLDMERPFTPMKALNMEEVISDIIAKIKS